MRRSLLAGLVLAALALPLGAADDKKGTKITMDGLSSTTPAGWVSEKPSNKMRFAQLRLPKAKGDKEDAELVIFKGISGSAKENIARWKGQFKAPKGKTIDDVSKVEDLSIGGNDAKQLDVSGIFQYNPAPFNPKSKTEARPDYRMIAIQFDGPDNTFHIKLTGPAKTIAQHKKDFDAWIKAFKK